MPVDMRYGSPDGIRPNPEAIKRARENFKKFSKQIQPKPPNKPRCKTPSPRSKTPSKDLPNRKIQPKPPNKPRSNTLSTSSRTRKFIEPKNFTLVRGKKRVWIVKPAKGGNRKSRKKRKTRKGKKYKKKY